MKNLSIFSFINIIFTIAFLAVVASFVLFLKYDRNRFQLQQQQRYSIIANAFLSGFRFVPTYQEIEAICNQFDVQPVTDPKERLTVLNRAKMLYYKESILGRIRIFKLNRDYYIYVQSYGYNLLLKDNKPGVYHAKGALIIFLALTVGLLFLYLSFLRKFKPLRDLQRDIDKFAKGDLNIHTRMDGKDEIAKVANSFDNAVKYINNLLDSRRLFMRNIMHELKTPIAKGRIAAEMVEDKENREFLINVFERINNIIAEIATIDRINTSTYQIEKEEVKIEDILKLSLEFLMTDKNKIEIDIKEKNKKIKADKKLMAVAIKNLIDNAIKFSPDSKAKVEVDKNQICIISKGEPLKKPIDYYLEPFSQEEKRKEGLGLGLYIVKNIAKLHNFEFIYEYKNSHYFCLKF